MSAIKINLKWNVDASQLVNVNVLKISTFSVHVNEKINTVRNILFYWALSLSQETYNIRQYIYGIWKCILEAQLIIRGTNGFMGLECHFQLSLC